MHRRDFATGLITGVVGGAVAKTAWGRNQTIPEFGRVTFSQQGEDIVLFHALHETLKIERPTYLDSGAAHPMQSNNTYLLYTTGGHGVLVEPNPVFVKLLRKFRPQDKHFKLQDSETCARAHTSHPYEALKKKICSEYVNFQAAESFACLSQD